MKRNVTLAPETRAYLADSYPRNHNYRVIGGALVPSWRLFRRYRRIRALYPASPTSLVDLSSNKGYFVLHAKARLGCARVLGIDVSTRDVEVSREVRDSLGQYEVELEAMTPLELDERLEGFGGAFEVALLINVYHYLFLGSRSDPRHFDSHADIFRTLRRICSGTLIFSNCVELDQLPRHLRAMAIEQGRDGEYHAQAIRAAAEPHFNIEDHGHLGKRPLWRLIARD